MKNWPLKTQNHKGKGWDKKDTYGVEGKKDEEKTTEIEKAH